MPEGEGQSCVSWKTAQSRHNFVFFNFSTNMYSTKRLCKMLIQSNDKNKIKLPQLTVQRDSINISY